MKKTCKKLVSVLLAAIMVFSLFTIVPFSVGALTQSEFDSRLNSLRSSYPNYSTWYNSFDGGTQCFGFARLMGYEVFGSYPSTWSVSYDFNSVEAGDIIRYGNNGSGGHSIFVTNVSGSTITFVDCNGNGNYSGATKVRTCGIKWDNTTTIGSRLFGYSFSYIRKSPGITSGNNPVGCVDSISGGTGKITIKGWAFDTDDINAQLNIHVYIGGEAGDTNAEGFGWIIANTSRPDVDTVYGCGGYHGIDIKLPTTKTGTQPVYIYAINVGGGNNVCIGSGTVNIKTDTETPTIEKSYVSHQEMESYRVCVIPKDNVGIKCVKVATWTQSNQSDLIWHDCSNNGYGTYYIDIKRSDYSQTKNSFYYNHIYVYDYAGNAVFKAQNTDYKITSDTGKTVENGKYRIVTAVDESKALDVYGANTDDNTNIQIYSNLNDKKQTFDINYIGDGFYTIFGSYSGKSIDVEGDSYKNRTNVILCGYNGGANQQWIIKPTDDGYYTIVARSNGLALDLAYAKNEDGANVQVHTVNGSIAQKWKLRRVLDSDMITVDTLTVDKDTQTLNPEIQAVADDKALVLNEDYTMEVKGDIESGSGTVTVTGIGDYCDSVTKTFDIVYNDEKLIGDVDGDGIISVSDATTLQKQLADGVEFGDEMLEVADANGDGIVSVSDATLIQKYLAGNASSLG